MSHSKDIDAIVLTIKEQLKTVDLIPKDFEPSETPMGIDRDILEESIYNWEHQVEFGKDVSILKDFKSFSTTLDEYISLFKKEIGELIFLEYTDPQSVHKIMDVIGTTGVLNTDQGLFICRPHLELTLDDTDYIVDNGRYISKITAVEKEKYDKFITVLSIK